MAATVALGVLGVLVAPHNSPAPHPAAASTAPTLAAPPSGPSDLEAVHSLQALAASESSQDVQEAAEASTQASASASRSQAATDASLSASRAARSSASASSAAARSSEPTPTPSPTPSPALARTVSPTSSGSYQDYALAALDGDKAAFTCLEHLWGKESGWIPTAQNPGTTAYGIAQFINSTWALTGIAKTSNGFRQIDAGLIYIHKVYGTVCSAWAHSQATGWY